MRIQLFAAVVLTASIGAAYADTSATELKNLERYQQYAGEPTQDFTMWSLYQWQDLGPDYVAVWSAVNRVYLLKVSKPCVNLDFANGISVTSQMEHKVTARFDYVNFDKQHCQIVEIRPIDYKRMLKEGKDSDPAVKG
jgi:Family of unknown function (DUF6491)